MPEGRPALYVYGVVRDGSTLDRLPAGVQDQPVGVVGHGDLLAVVSEVADGAPLGRRRDLTAHHEVLRTLALEVDVAPMQFGLVMPSEEEVVAEVLDARRGALDSVLSRVAGMVQRSVRAAFDEQVVLAEIVAENPEVRRLRERTRDRTPVPMDPELVRLGELVAHDLERRRRAEADRMLARILPVTEAVHHRQTTDPHTLVDLAVLVRRNDVDEVERVMEDLAEEVHPRVRLRLTAPTAAFDFVEEPSWA